MLKNRLITTLLIAPLIILAVLFLPAKGFAIFWGIIIVGAAWEWSDLAGFSGAVQRLLFAGSVAGLLVAAKWFLGSEMWDSGTLDWLSWPVLGWWLIVALLMRRAPEKLVAFRYPTAIKLAAGAFVLVTAWVWMSWLRFNFGAYQVLYLLFLIWFADAAAYFVGQKFGTNKLLEPISPGKTVEGVYGALFVALLFALAIGFYREMKGLVIADFVMLSLLTVVMSVCGDLFESLAKRVRGVKDSGRLFPGHGGILDRIDSLIAATPMFYAGCLLRGFFLQ